MKPESERQQELDKIIAEYFRQAEIGVSVSISHWIELHAEYRQELEGFFQDDAEVNSLAAPIRATLDPIAHLEPQRQLGDFAIIREIGRGGMGVVYEAEQVSLSRRVALKLLPFAAILDDQQLRRFKNEAHAAAVLQHVGIVSVFYVGCDRGVHFYAMPLIDGRSLAELNHAAISPQPSDYVPRPPGADGLSTTTPLAALETALSSPGQNRARCVAELGAQAAEALAYAHGEGIIHRDIKPSNLLIDLHGRLKITDFGLARIGNTGDHTPTGQILGTFRYMSPEQLLTDQVLDHRTDIYSLGVTLYELLAQRPAFVETGATAIARQVQETEPPRLKLLDPTIPVDIDTIVQHAMAKDRDHRYATAQELADDLRRFLTHRPIHARPTSRLERIWRWYRRSPVVAVLSAVIVVLCLGIAAAAMALASRETQDRQRAEQITEVAKFQQYVSDMQAAASAWNESNVSRTVQLLDQYFPAPGEQDLRGFEWYHLWRKCDMSRPLLSIAHPVAPWCAAYSPDGLQLATGAEDGIVRLWNAADGTLTNTLDCRSGMVRTVEFSPSGKWLATGGYDGIARLWDVATGRQLHELLGHEQSVERVMFSADDARLLTSSNDLTLRTWDLATGQVIDVSKSRSIQFVGPWINGQIWLDPGARSTAVDLVDTHDGRTVKTLSRPELAQSANLGFLGVSVARDLGITGAQDGLIRFFRLSNEVELSAADEHRRAISALAVSSDGQWCASGDVTGHIVVWNLESRTAHHRFAGHSSPITRLAWSPQADRLVSVATDHSAKIWSPSAIEGSDIRRDHRDLFLQIALRPTGRYLATVGSDPEDELFLWDTTTGERIASLTTGHRGAVNHIAFSPDGHELATSSADGSIRRWDFDRRTLRSEVFVTDWELRTLAYSRQGSELVTSDETGLVHVLRTGPGALRQSFRASDSAVNALAVSPDGKSLAVGADGALTLFDFPACEQQFRSKPFGSRISSLVYSPDGLTVACGCRSGEVVLVANDGTERFRLSHDTPVVDIAFSTDGQSLVTCGESPEILLWGLSRRAIRGRLSGHDIWVNQVCFSPDGETLVSAGNDGTVRFWRTAGQSDSLGKRDELKRLFAAPTFAATKQSGGFPSLNSSPEQWHTALASLESRLRQSPHDMFTLYRVAILDLHLGNGGGCQRLTDHWLQAFESTLPSNVPEDYERTALAIVLNPRIDAQRLTHLHTTLQRLINIPDHVQRRFYGWTLLSMGLTELRLGNASLALPRLQQALASHHPDQLRTPMTRLALALTYQRLQQHELAQRSHAQARTELDDYRRWLETRSSEADYPWQDLLACELLRAEVERVSQP